MSTNFETLQAAWKACDQQLASQKAMNEKLMLSMMRDRSGSTLAAMSRKNGAMAFLFSVYTVFFIACIAGNAFDYTHPLYYIPLAVQGITCGIFATWLLLVYRAISRVGLSGENLAGGLRQVIRANEQHLVVSRRIWWCYFIAGVAFPFTFLPRAIDHWGLSAALGFMAIPVVIMVALVLLAKRLHFFEDRQHELLKQNLDELEDYLAELERA